MKFQGLRKTKVLKTAEDVLEHSYGQKAAEGSAPAAPPSPSPATPPPASEPEGDGEGEEETEKEYADRLEEDNNKDVLVEMAEERELSIEGYKRDLAARIAEYDYSEE